MFDVESYGKEYRQRPEVKAHRNEYWKEYRKKNPEKRRIIDHKSIQKSRMKVLKAYSKNEKIECAICGFDNILALHIDHINNGGVKHRKKVTGINCSNRTYYNWFVKNNFPEGFQILCANCNTVKEMKRRGF